ncbi:MFS family permease [Paenibacillus shirakamiensis]|uniref:MFS family permease n=1 Tax=Paenibacillus shirakamiensis TaxID=1265935 RepID=A0ABS4JF87_9BACL|nr:MFS transporter [Paenibacillus shirakamiensis]MBP2000362.1 MFS family permease [Paenibacillus shirakamiensis]
MKFMQQTRVDITSWSRNIKLFFLANILYQLGTGTFSLLYNLYIQNLGYDDSMNGRIVSIQSLATALMFVPIGLLGDRVSRKKLLIIGALFSGLFFVGRSLMVSEGTLLTFAVFSGLFGAVFQVLSIPYLAQNATKHERLRMFSYFSSAMLASQVLGNIGGGIIADLLQTLGLSRLVSLQFVLVMGSIMTLSTFVPLLLLKETKIQEEVPVIHSDEIPEPPKAVAQPTAAQDYRFIAKFVLTNLLIGFGSGLVVPYLNLYFTNRFSVSLSAMSILISLGQIMTIFSLLMGTLLASKVGNVRAVVIFQLLSLPFLLLTGFTNLLWIASISFLFRQALMNSANPIQSTVMIDRVSSKRQGLANSLMQTAFMMGWATMGPVQSYLVITYGSYYGYAYTFSITGALYVTSSLLYFLMLREKRPARIATLEA